VLGHPLRVFAPASATLLLLGLLWSAVPAGAAPGSGSATEALVLTGPSSARIGTTVPVRATFADTGARPAPGSAVQLEKQGSDDAWSMLSTSTTTDDGVATFSVAVASGSHVFRARYGGSDNPTFSDPITLTGVVVASAVHVYGSRSVVDETSGHLSVRWVGSDDLGVRGTVVVYYRHSYRAGWSRLTSVTTGSDGRAKVVIKPRRNTFYQLRGPAGIGWRSDTSPSWFVDNRPPRIAVTLPWNAPRPRSLPAQRRAVGPGANVAVHLVPDSVWRSMVGRSWHAGCPVGRSQLRYLTVNYWGFDGYRHRGELVVRDTKVTKFKVAFTKLYGAGIRIRAMYLPDRFGRSVGAYGANDRESMRHDNTSAFNCRSVTGDPGRRSPHTYGGSVDINTWENPFHSHVGWLPDSWWAHRQVGSYAWKSRSHPVVQMMTAAGFRWTYGTTDSQHFDG
jgi:hypothetical protein